MTRTLHPLTRRTPRLLLLLLSLTLLLLSAAHTASAQTTTFTYQGRLTDAGALANGSYDFQFSLFDGAGVQQGASLERPGVALTDGSFVAQLDFGDVFDGTDRVLEIGVRPGGSADAYTILDPRWPITSTPYAIRSLKAAASDTATNATTADTATTATDATQLGGVAADQYVKTDDPRLGGEGGNFIQNGVTPQAEANFNIAGDGIIGGNVGIGILNPANKLEVNGAVLMMPGGSGGNIAFGTPNAETGMTIIGTNRADVRFDGTTLKLLTGTGRTSPSIAGGMAISAAYGNVGIGTINPTSKLEIIAQNGLAITGFQPFLTLRDTAGGNRSGFVQSVNGDVILLTNNRSALTVKDGTGTVNVRTLAILGGADFSENFDVNVSTAGGQAMAGKVQAGMVVSIDPINPGKLSLAARAYDRRVAGIISGAGGVRTGMMMSHEGTLADGKHPVALSGRVYAWVDATRGAIKPGDMLTTSTTPGHAMKVINRARAQGAIIGKAMTGLKSGRGLVLVLVTLQ